MTTCFTSSTFPEMQSSLGEKRLQVLEIVTQYGSGGIQRHVLNLRDWLLAQGHTVTLSGTPDVWAGPKTDPGFLVLPTRYVASDGGSIPARLGHAVRAAWLLRRWLAKNPVDLIHCHESAPGLIAILARIGCKIPVAITYHGAEPKRIPSFGNIARRCDMVFATNEYSARDLETIGKVPRNKIRVIYLGLQPPPDYNAEEIAAMRRELLWDGNRLIVSIARLTYQKAIDVMIDCVARIKDSRPGYRFVIAGDGPEEEKLLAQARALGVDHMIKLYGRTEQPHLLLHAADLFLLTSRWEAKPLAILEAFQVGTPSVATACSGVFELIDETVGAVVPIGDVPAICEAVTGILDDEPRRAKLAQAAHARSQQNQFNPDILHHQFETAYFKLAGR